MASYSGTGSSTSPILLLDDDDDDYSDDDIQVVDYPANVFQNTAMKVKHSLAPGFVGKSTNTHDLVQAMDFPANAFQTTVEPFQKPNVVTKMTNSRPVEQRKDLKRKRGDEPKRQAPAKVPKGFQAESKKARKRRRRLERQMQQEMQAGTSNEFEPQFFLPMLNGPPPLPMGPNPYAFTMALMNHGMNNDFNSYPNMLPSLNLDGRNPFDSQPYTPFADNESSQEDIYDPVKDGHNLFNSPWTERQPLWSQPSQPRTDLEPKTPYFQESSYPSSSMQSAFPPISQPRPPFVEKQMPLALPPPPVVRQQTPEPPVFAPPPSLPEPVEPYSPKEPALFTTEPPKEYLRIGMAPDQDPHSKHGTFNIGAPALITTQDTKAGKAKVHMPNPACTLVLEQLPKTHRQLSWVRNWCMGASKSLPVWAAIDPTRSKVLVEFANAELARKAWDSPRLGQELMGLKSHQIKGRPREDQIKAWWYRIEGIGAGGGVGEIEEGEIEGEENVEAPKETKKQKKQRMQQERMAKLQEQALQKKVVLAEQLERQRKVPPHLAGKLGLPPSTPSQDPAPLEERKAAGTITITRPGRSSTAMDSAQPLAPAQQPEPPVQRPNHGTIRISRGSKRLPSPATEKPVQQTKSGGSSTKVAQALPTAEAISSIVPNVSDKVNKQKPQSSLPLPKSPPPPANTPAIPLPQQNQEHAPRRLAPLPSKPSSSLTPLPAKPPAKPTKTSSLPVPPSTLPAKPPPELVMPVDNDVQMQDMDMDTAKSPLTAKSPPPVPPAGSPSKPNSGAASPSPAHAQALREKLVARQRELEERIAREKAMLSRRVAATENEPVVAPPMSLSPASSSSSVSPTVASSANVSLSFSASSSTTATTEADSSQSSALNDMAESFLSETFVSLNSARPPLMTKPHRSSSESPPPPLPTSTAGIKMELAAKQKRLEQHIFEAKELMGQLAAAKTKQEKDRVLGLVRENTRAFEEGQQKTRPIQIRWPESKEGHGILIVSDDEDSEMEED